MKTESVSIKGMSCSHCVMAVKNELSRLPIAVKNVTIGSAEVEYDENKVSRKEITEAIERAGYEAA